MKRIIIVFLVLISSCMQIQANQIEDGETSLDIGIDYTKAVAAGVLSVFAVPTGYLAYQSFKAGNEHEELNTFPITLFFASVSGGIIVTSNKLVDSMSEKRKPQGLFAKCLGLSLGSSVVAKRLDEEYYPEK